MDALMNCIHSINQPAIQSQASNPTTNMYSLLTSEMLFDELSTSTPMEVVRNTSSTPISTPITRAPMAPERLTTDALINREDGNVLADFFTTGLADTPLADTPLADRTISSPFGNHLMSRTFPPLNFDALEEEEFGSNSAETTYNLLNSSVFNGRIIREHSLSGIIDYDPNATANELDDVEPVEVDSGMYELLVTNHGAPTINITV